MINIFEDLSTIGLKVYQQGSAPDRLPRSFYTIWNDATDDLVSADNDAKSMSYEWTAIYYTKDYSTLMSGIANLKNLLKSKGYIISGIGHDIGGSFEEYQARAIEVKKIEIL